MTFKREETKANANDAGKRVARKKEGTSVQKTKLILVKEVYDYERNENIEDFPLSIFPQCRSSA